MTKYKRFEEELTKKGFSLISDGNIDTRRLAVKWSVVLLKDHCDGRNSVITTFNIWQPLGDDTFELVEFMTPYIEKTISIFQKYGGVVSFRELFGSN